MPMKKLQIFILGAGLGLLLRQGTWGLTRYDPPYGAPYLWDCNKVDSGATLMKLLPVSFPPGSVWAQAFASAINEYNTDVPGSYWRYSYTWDSDNTYNLLNGTSEVFFGKHPFMGSARGATWPMYDVGWTWSCGFYLKDIHAADIMFNPDYCWDPSLTRQPNRTCANNIKEVAMHELGHAAGLLHEWRSVSTMGYSYIYFGENKDQIKLSSNHKQGMRNLYGSGGAGTDVAVHDTKYAGFMYLSRFEGDDASLGTQVGQSLYVTDPTQPYAYMEYTFENHGSSSWSSVKHSYYMLRDGAWRELGNTVGFTLPPGYVGTWPRWLSIPLDTPPGYYPFKVVVDSDNQLIETNESNNVMILPNPIYVGFIQSPTLSARAVSSEQIDLNWTTPPSPSGVGSYTIQAYGLFETCRWRLNRETWEVELVCGWMPGTRYFYPGLTNSFSVHGLYPDQPYNFWVKACDPAGRCGAWSNSIGVRTLPGPLPLSASSVAPGGSQPIHHPPPLSAEQEIAARNLGVVLIGKTRDPVSSPGASVTTSTETPAELPEPVRRTFRYDPGDLPSGIQTSDLKLHVWDGEEGAWQPAEGAVHNTQDGIFTLDTQNPGDHRIFASAAQLGSGLDDLSLLKVFPNPWVAGGGPQNASHITFQGLTSQARVQIFSVSGDRVAELENKDTSDRLAWDLLNSAGSPVASGTYLYVVTNPHGARRKGALAIVR